jgi:indolepyruvate ferredoxin oxidoreductase
VEVIVSISELQPGAAGEVPPTVQGPASELSARYRLGERPVLLTGVQAVARLLVEQHARDAAAGLRTATLVSGYGGSPLGGLDRTLAGVTELARHDVHLRPGVNEELGATAVWGSQVELPQGNRTHDGIIGVWYGKAPGVDRAGDAMRHGATMGAHRHGGVLVLAGDDPGCKSSTLPSASEATLAALGMPVLFPRDAQDVITLGLYGVALSRASGCWVALKIVSDVADGLCTVDRDFAAMPIVIPSISWNGEPWSYQQRLTAVAANSMPAEGELIGPRMALVRAFAAANPVNAIDIDPPGARIGVVAAGKTYRDTVQALRDLGVDTQTALGAGIRVLRIGMLHPLDDAIVRQFAAGLEQILVVEEKGRFLEAQIRDALYGSAGSPVVTGKLDAAGMPLVPADGELTAARLAAPLRRALGSAVALRDPAPARQPVLLPLAVQRNPFFCSGCPHSLSTAVPDGSLAGAGIGCHAMVLRQPRMSEVMTGITQMGGEGAQWLGQAPFTDVPHLFQNMGDGTYFHSGQLAIQAAVAAGSNITFKILYNSAVAMTGGQSAQGSISVPALTRKLQAEGVTKVIVCADDPAKYGRRAKFAPGVSVRHRDRLDEAQRELREVSGVTVLIFDQRCAAEARRLRKRGALPARTMRLAINDRVCEGCGDCGAKSSCLSLEPIQTEFGRKTAIAQSSCNTDYSCLSGNCPSFVSVQVAPGARRAAPAPAVSPPALSDPQVPELTSTWNVYLAGIGGTGIVTVNQVLATAAMLDGLEVSGLDQTGLSQKAGPVTSHLRLAPRGEAANRIGAGQADCFLICDLLVGAEERNLACASADRTVTVASVSQVPTGPMVQDSALRYPALDDLLGRLDEHAARLISLDAMRICSRAFGDTTAANIVVVGAGYQAGAIPISAASIEEAIRLNGVEVGRNIAAFRWGRAVVADPAAVSALTGAASDAEPAAAPRPGISHFTGETAAVIARSASELAASHGRRAVDRYLATMNAVWTAERAVGDATHFSAAAARSLYHLTAYKDEYEVARLLTAPEFEQQLKADFPGATKVSYNLQPPVLRSLGLNRKIRLGPAFRPGLRMLARGRVVRGTPLDPFGHTPMRKTERALAREFEALLTGEAAALTADGYERATQIASAPLLVKGYEEIKLANIEKYQARLAELGVAAT